MGFLCKFRTFCVCLLALFTICLASVQHIGRIYPGFEASHNEWIDHQGIFLLSNSSVFGLRFYTSLDVQLFLLVVIHIDSGKVVWTANRGYPNLITSSDKFVFDTNGNAYLKKGDNVVWSTNTEGKKAKAIELRNSGNLVLLDENELILWQSFSHPTDTLLPGQMFISGMRLKSFPNDNNLSVFLELENGDLILYAGYQTPQRYWSLGNDTRKTNYVNGNVQSAMLVSNSWNFYNQHGGLLSQLNFSDYSSPNATWAAVLGSKGEISFYNLRKGKTVTPEGTKIPQSTCSTPEPCNRYQVCYFDNWCQCPSALIQFGCRPPVPSSTCGSSVKLFEVGEKLDYFALGFMSPILKPTLHDCQEACLNNCSCFVLFFDNSTGSCYMFDEIGDYQRAGEGSSGYVSFMKLSIEKSGRKRNHTVWIAVILVGTVLVLFCLIYAGMWDYRKNRKIPEIPDDDEDDNFLSGFPGMPTRFNYTELCRATENFSRKVGQGGFGSVYLGVLPDGTQLAVKQLEGIGQGKKEFRAEVCIIGSVHHFNLVKLKGFCTEGAHRLLVYEYMENGSLDKWIFKKNENTHPLDWKTRFNIMLGTAKGLAYLHEECELKIVHCDIKPENVLLDEKFTAKVSDFGLAKLMNREESLVYTTLRGTRGYLAPEWITNNPISQKSDVYSYGMVLLEIIGGRKNYDPSATTEKAHFPSYALQMVEEGNFKQILDPRLDLDQHDEMLVTIAIRVALWCIQDDMNLRPPMTKVVQMLEGLCPVPEPPVSAQLSCRAYADYIKWSSSKASSSSGPCDSSNDTFLSNFRLSGPR